ncbi:MAG: electron transport complex subunit RsxC [Clostridiales bacterium]|nr:electron transport complex subunit RsxC [Clostridiales bacterium]MDD6390122.1 electron transport complex subunit RsxC [Bacillota bacterium]MDY5975374.1 electron transport complex subunit RsxC [Anaerovoracaceae bacterium]
MSQKKHLNSAKTPHYKHTADCATVAMPIPDEVRISMSHNIGKHCQPLVGKGDEVKVGQPIGDVDAFISAPIHSSVSGVVKAIETQRGGMGGEEQVIVIETDKKQEVWDGLKIPEVNSHADFVKAVRDSGVVGLGGASFPTHVKYNPQNLDECHTLIINAAECEPFITCDNRTMLEDAENLIYGMEQIMKWLELDQAYVGIEENKPEAIAHLDKLFSEKGLSDRMHTFTLQSRYPKGAERVLVYEITGKTMNAGVLPAQLGIILSNVTTVAAVGAYLQTGMPYVLKTVTVDGDAVAEPKNVKAPIGTTVYDIVQFCGGYSKPVRKIILGGPMMGRTIASDAVGIVKYNSAILAFSEEMGNFPVETACINCGRCHSVCPAELMPSLLADAYSKKDVDRLKEIRVMQCMECGSCSFICPAHRPLVFMHKLSKGLVKEAGN